MEPLPPKVSYRAMRLDFLTLRLFVAVSEENSIAAAAARENLVPSAVSKRLAMLEDSLGVSLVNRHTKGVTLTPAGETLLLRARDILRSVDSTASEISEYTSNGFAQVRLSANHSSIVQFLASDLATFLQANPRTKIDLVERLSADVVRSVADGHSDVGVYCWPLLPKGLVAYPYRQDELVLTVPRDHPLAQYERIAFVQAQPYQFIDYFPNVSASVVMPEFLNRSMSRVRVHVANFEATFKMVKAGLGIALLPLASVSAHGRGEIVCVRLSDDWAKRELQMCVREGTETRRSVAEFIDHLRNSAVAPASPTTLLAGRFD